MHTLVVIVSFLLYLYSVLLLLKAVVSFLRPDPSNEFIHWLNILTEPILEPIRTVLPQTGIDFSPLIAMILVFALSQLLSILAGSL